MSDLKEKCYKDFEAKINFPLEKLQMKQNEENEKGNICLNHWGNLEVFFNK